MNNPKLHICDERLIDCALGNLSGNAYEEVSEHLKQCEQCTYRLNEWQQTLGITINAVPSVKLKNQIWESIQEEKKLFKKKRSRKFIVYLSSAAALFLLLIGMLSHYQSNMVSYEVATNDDIQEQMIQSKPETQRLAVMPVANHEDINGNLWINNDTQELLLEVNGLVPIVNRDYQLWIIYENNKVKGELLVPVDGSSRVWIRGNDVNQFKFLKASIEPIGGSIEPTGPETFVIPIK